MRLKLAYLMRRYMLLIATYVFPLPVAICINARGCNSANDSSSSVIASYWQFLRLPLINGCMPDLSISRGVCGTLNASNNACGVWNVKTRLDREFGSRRLRKNVSTPVEA